MNDYEEILRQAKEQNFSFNGKSIVIPYSNNIFYIDGNQHFGRLFDDEDILYLVYDVEDEYEGHKELILYRVVEHFSTWVHGDTVSHLVEFFTVE